MSTRLFLLLPVWIRDRSEMKGKRNCESDMDGLYHIFASPADTRVSPNPRAHLIPWLFTFIHTGFANLAYHHAFLYFYQYWNSFAVGVHFPRDSVSLKLEGGRRAGMAIEEHAALSLLGINDPLPSPDTGSIAKQAPLWATGRASSWGCRRATPEV